MAQANTEINIDLQVIRTRKMLEKMDKNNDKQLTHKELQAYIAAEANSSNEHLKSIPCNTQNNRATIPLSQEMAIITQAQMDYYNSLLKSPLARTVFSKDFTVISATAEDVRPMVDVLMNFRSACRPRT